MTHHVLGLNASNKCCWNLGLNSHVLIVACSTCETRINSCLVYMVSMLMTAPLEDKVLSMKQLWHICASLLSSGNGEKAMVIFVARHISKTLSTLPYKCLKRSSFKRSVLCTYLNKDNVKKKVC